MATKLPDHISIGCTFGQVYGEFNVKAIIARDMIKSLKESFLVRNDDSFINEKMALNDMYLQLQEMIKKFYSDGIRNTAILDRIKDTH